ncbi:hypothetical protein QUF49_02290 [Fictibacillus sp. b24]|uniref:hypothetical protein n=1 Tax=Fictibacillus sp. b24 TaxID=3055863 RepID=UPI0025A09DE1|nr:hypothetical protein [Fictibacillus sp. b24]MDM5314803.1 hypothetical protein [Fictibacillus sp. b24]
MTLKLLTADWGNTLKTKTYVSLAISIVFLLSLYFIIRPNEISFQELELNNLSPETHKLITRSTLEKGSAYHFFPKTDSQKSIYFYFDRNDSRNLYSYPKATLVTQKDKLQIRINNQDAYHDADAKDTLLLEFEQQPFPKHIEVLFNNRKIGLKTITY